MNYQSKREFLEVPSSSFFHYLAPFRYYGRQSFYRIDFCFYDNPSISSHDEEHNSRNVYKYVGGEIK